MPTTNNTHAQFVRTSFEKIKEASDTNRLVLFIGSGVSINSNVPSWVELVKTFATELGIDTSKINNTTDTNTLLKIPQQYEVHRGKKEYWDLIQKVIGQDYMPNQINEAIFKLKPSSIITTNFDDLIEQAANIERERYHLVAKNEDLPYARHDNMLIKMHGDLKQRNIVLKESDYLRFSRDFIAIETYIKALFSYKLVLFLGYSANDPDFKLMFQSVKDVLGGDFQPAYLINTSDYYDQLEFEYYRDRGINLLFCKEIESDITTTVLASSPKYKEVQDNRGKLLLNTINYIAIFSKESVDVLEEIHTALQPLNNFDLLLPEFIESALKSSDQHTVTYSSGRLWIHDGEYQNYFAELISLSRWRKFDKTKIQKLRNIRDILSKAMIHGVVVDNNISFTIKTDKHGKIGEEYEDKLLSFRFNEIFEEIQKEASLPNNLYEDRKNALKLAYQYFEIGLPLESYTILKNLLFLFDSDDTKEQFFEFITRTNIRGIGFYVRESRDSKGKKRDFDKMYVLYEKSREIGGIQRNKLYDQMDIRNRKVLEPLYSFDVFYRMRVQAEDSVEEISKQKFTTEKGGWQSGGHLSSVAEMLWRLYSFSYHNFLTIDRYTEIHYLYYSILRSLYISHSTNTSHINEREFFGRIEDSYLKEISYLAVYCSVRYVDTPRLLRLFDSINLQRISYNIEVKDSVLAAFENLIESSKNKQLALPFEQYISTFTLLLCYSQWSPAEMNRILKAISENISLRRNENICFSTTKFIESSQVNNVDLEANVLERILYTLFRDILAYNDRFIFDIYAGKLLGLFSTIVLILKKKNYILSPNTLIGIIVEKTRHSNIGISSRNEICISILFALYDIVPQDEKTKIIDTTHALLEENSLIKEQRSLMPSIFDIIYEGALKNMITIDDALSTKYINYLRDYISDGNTDIDENITGKSEDTRYLNQLAFLIANRYIKRKAISKNSFKITTPFLDFVLSPNKFDHTKFEAQWLYDLPENTIRRILKAPNRAKTIQSKLLDLLQTQPHKEEWRDLYNRYFL